MHDVFVENYNQLL